MPITTEGIRIPVTTEDRLKVTNLEIIWPTDVIFSEAKVHKLFQIKLEIIDSSAAMALQRPFKRLMFEVGVIKRDLKILAPTVLTTKPKPPTMPNLRNF